MNRSVRNGLAIAGMAGGLFFLGQAVASASDQVASADNSTDQVTTSTDSHDSSGANRNESDATAKNVDVTRVDSTVTGGSGGVNEASINTGVISGGLMETGAVSTQSRPSGDDEHHGDNHGTTVNVSLTQNANGGSVNGSGNIAVAGGGNQTATASNTVSQSTTSTGDEHHGREHHDGNNNGPDSLSPSSMGGNDHHNGGNKNESDADAKNVHVVDVDSTVTGGAGGSNSADINTGIIGNTFYCPEHSTCTYNFTTGDVTVYQNANGGDVNNSGNIGIGAPVPGSGANCGCPAKPEAAKPAVKPAMHPASAPAKHSAAVLSSSQPSGQLAFTGSDVSLPLTVGLLALVAGLGLTVLGRRRETQAI
jgi:hypothetical protein